jgi:high-affinity iron transporter
MLPAFVIGLREGLETVVILGAISLFLSHQGRRDQLKSVWIAASAAAGLCVAIAVILSLVEVNLSPIAEDKFEAIVGTAAVLTVTYMVIWMRRFPKDLLQDSSVSAATKLARGSGGALAAMAFFAVLREGFEIVVFVLALVGAKESGPLPGIAGAVAGVLVSIIVGIAVVRGGRHLDIARFFRATAIVLVLAAAGLAMTTIHAANAAGWLVFGQDPQFDWSRFAHPGTVLSSIVTGMFGIQPYPVLIDVVVWLAYLIPMLLVVTLPRRTSRERAPRSPAKSRRIGVILACEVVVVACTVVVLRAALNDTSEASAAGLAQMPVPPQGLSGGKFLLFRDTEFDSDFGRLGLVTLNNPKGPRAMTSLSCDRVDFEGGLGLCLNLPTSGLDVSTSAIVFNSHFKVLHQVPLTGYPSRARVSPNGQYGAVTTFLTGDSYAKPGSFSTRTDIIDMRTGKVMFDLGGLAVTRNGVAFHAVDFNFWGVTFANDGTHFYVTLGTGGQTYLINGNLKTRRASVIASNVACPSLSPDGRQIAFKRLVPHSGVMWRLAVLDLKTMKVHLLAETRSVDDQVEWLNNTTIIYGLEDVGYASLYPFNADPPSTISGLPQVTSTWSVPADGKGHPRVLSSGTWSEVVTTR